MIYKSYNKFSSVYKVSRWDHRMITGEPKRNRDFSDQDEIN